MHGVRHDDLRHQPCAVARSVAVLGERWTFVILREVFMGARRFEDFQSGTGVARNILTDRLKSLVEQEILDRRPYAEHPGRTLHEYRLTPKGRDLYPILVSLMQWGNAYGGFQSPPVRLVHEACGMETDPRFVCSHCGGPVDPREMRPVVEAAATA